jgi:hypothetical protein
MFGAWLSNGAIDGKVTKAALKKESEGGMERQWREGSVQFVGKPEAGSRGPKGLFVCTELVSSLPCASR